jgi:chromosome segregation ATPase
MASQEVLASLEVLHREIERLEPAITHVEAALKVTKIAKTITDKHMEYLETARSENENHQNTLKTIFTNEISNFSKENKRLQQNTDNLQKQILLLLAEVSKINLELYQEVKVSDIAYKNDLKALFERELLVISNEVRNVESSTIEIQHQIRVEQEALRSLVEKVEVFYDRVGSINFSERLDELDAKMDRTTGALHSIKSHFNTLERNIFDRFNYIQGDQKEIRGILQNEFEQSKLAISNNTKKQETLIYVTWVLIVISVIVNFMLGRLF